VFGLRLLKGKKIKYLDDRLVGQIKFGQESREIFSQECVVDEEIKFLSADRLGVYVAVVHELSEHCGEVFGA
jgi:hypothetical protein